MTIFFLSIAFDLPYRLVSFLFDLQVTLKSCELDPEATIFELFPVSQKVRNSISSALNLHRNDFCIKYIILL